MLSIRLTRIGKKKQPTYRVIVTEKTRDPWGKALEILGHYNPRTNPSTIEFKEDRIKYWLSVGAQPTATMKNLLISQGIMEGDKASSVRISKKRKAKMDEKNAEKAEAEKAAEEAPAEEAAEAPADAPTEDAPAEAPAEAPEEPAAEEKAEEAPAEEAAPEETPAE